MVTDGIIEARSSNRWVFGKAGMMQYLYAETACAPDEIAAGMLRAATEYTGGRLQDDAAIVVVKLGG